VHEEETSGSEEDDVEVPVETQPQRPQDIELLDAIDKGDPVRVEAALGSGASANARYPSTSSYPGERRRALDRALEVGDPIIERMLVARGARASYYGISNPDDEHSSDLQQRLDERLCEAVDSGSADEVRLLLDVGADRRARSASDHGAIDRAQAHHPEILEILLLEGRGRAVRFGLQPQTSVRYIPPKEGKCSPQPQSTGAPLPAAAARPIGAPDGHSGHGAKD